MRRASVFRHPIRVALAALCGIQILFWVLLPFPASAGLANHVVISEVQAAGDGSSAASDEFIELYNPTSAEVDISTWSIQFRGGGAASFNKKNLPSGAKIAAHGYYLIANTGYNGSSSPDTTYSSSIAMSATGGTVFVVSDQTLLSTGTESSIVDKVAYGAATGSGSLYPEGAAIAAPSANGSIERKAHVGSTSASMGSGGADESAGNGEDSDDNSADFVQRTTSQPQNSSSSTETPPTPTPTNTSADTDTPTPTPTNTPTPIPARAVIINEVAWAGTAASSADEWIELRNTTGADISLANWTLTDGGDINITLSGTIAANGYFLLERTDDSTVSDVAADQIYTGGLGNGGETLTLKDASGNVIDTANGDGGSWPGGTAGGGSPAYATMERVANASAESDADWGTNDGLNRNGSDADGNALNGTPRSANSGTYPTATPTPTATPSPTATTTPPLAVVINEVAWMGTDASSADEWIELHNPGASSVDVTGWTLTDGGDIAVTLAGVIAAGGFYLLERTDDTTVSDIAADLIYTGGLSNDGETLVLRDALGATVDSASGLGGWPAGDSGAKATMERINPLAPDTAGNWATNYGHVLNGEDANGNHLRGTARAANSTLSATPSPSSFSRDGCVVINEVVPHPGQDYSHDGEISSASDEFIELINLCARPVDIGGWWVDDGAGGSKPSFIWLGTIIEPNGLWVFYRAWSKFSLNDDSDSARLLYPDGSVADEVGWTRDPGKDRSISRSPDGTGGWNFGWQPSPGARNLPWDTADTSSNPGPPPVVALGAGREWSDGAWITFVGIVTGPAPLFGPRVIYAGDGTSGIAVYLGSGVWPPMMAGQTITAFGYLRTRNGERELYVKNSSQVGLGEILPAPTPIAALTGQVGDATEGRLVKIAGSVVRLESDAFWIDDGSGAARVFFRASTGLDRPRLRRGERWQVVGIVSEFTTASSEGQRFRVLPRFSDDVVRIDVEPAPQPGFIAVTGATPTPSPTPSAQPTPSPTLALALTPVTGRTIPPLASWAQGRPWYNPCWSVLTGTPCP